MSKIIFLIAGVIMIFVGCNKINTKSILNECSIEMVENSISNDIDYYKIANGICLNYAFYEENILSGNIVEIIYPIVSRRFIDSLMTIYSQSTPDENISEENFGVWISQNDDIKPKVFVKSSIKGFPKGNFDKFMEEVDGKEVEGTRMTSFVDLSDKILEKLPQGITMENTLFIEEGVKPSENKLLGWVFLIIGLVISIGAGYSLGSLVKED